MFLSRTVRYLLGLVCLVLISSPPTLAGINTWTIDGPFGGQVVSLAMHPGNPSVLYAAARDGGFWRTFDGGETWMSAQDVLLDFSAEAVAFHPEDSTVVFGVTNSQFLRSVALQPWETVSNELQGFRFSGALHFDAANPDTLYLGTLNNGVLKSVDGGQTWEVLGPVEVPTALFITQDPGNGQVLYTGGFSTSGLVRSSDGGATWTDLGPVANTYVQDLAVDPLNADILWAATPRGLYRSQNGGASWETRNPGLDDDAMEMVRFDPRRPQRLYVGSRFGLGLARSDDGGNTWMVQPLDRQTSAIKDMAFDPTGGETIYLAVDRGGGVYRSLSGGATWQWTSSGMSAATITGLAVDPISGTVLAASTGSSIFRRDGIGNWQPLLNSPRNGNCCFDIVAAPGEANTFYVSGNDGVYRTVDGGATWQTRSLGFLPFSLADNLVIDPADSQRLFMSAFGGIYSSLDGGVSWTLLTEGLPEDFMFDVAVDPGDSQVLYAVSTDRLYRSADGGTSWVSVSGDVPLDFEPFAVTVSPADSSILLVGTTGDGVLRSLDGGLTWEDVGVSDNALVQDVTFNTLGSAVAVTTRGLWRSALNGAFWEPVGELDAARASVFAAAVENGPVTTYFVGTNGASSWSLTEGCIPSDTVLCIDDFPGDRRFAISMNYDTLQGGPQSGPAEVTVLEELGIRQGGVFSFFGRQNPEVLVKVLNGCAFNDRYWVFAAATTNVGYDLTVRDTRTEQSRVYSNQDGTVATTVTDTDALATCPLPGGPTVTAPPSIEIQSEKSGGTNLPVLSRQELSVSKGLPGTCQADVNTLCIDDNPGDQRFAVRLRFDTTLGDGAAGDAMATSLLDLGVTDGGILSFFDVTNPEVLIKVINGCDFNGHYWVFYAAATNLGFRVEVEDTSTGVIWESTNPDGLPALTITDTTAMATCDG